MQTDYFTTNVLTKWTFESKPIREWTESHLQGKVLNACAGKTRLHHTNEIITNDLNEDLNPDYSIDVAELSKYLDESSFDTIVFDPPWTLYQANLRYDGNHVYSTGDNIDSKININELPIDIDKNKSQYGHARLAKENFDYLLKDGGKVIQITYHGTCMPDRLNYKREERVIFDPIGENKAVIGSVDIKQGVNNSNKSFFDY